MGLSDLSRGGTEHRSALERFAPSMVALEPLVDPRLGVGHELTSPSRTMLLAIAAASHNRPPPFHFFEFTSGLPVKRLFVRDPDRVWCQHGVPGFGDTIDAVAGSLKMLLDEQDVERLVVIGSSAGGYAALAFGALLEADLVLSFAPQTILDRAWREEVGDLRWNGYFNTLDALGGPDPRWVDLRVALPRELRPRTVCELHYPALFEDDARHAERLAGVEGVKLVAHERSYHNFIQGLRNRGELTEIFRSAGLAVGDGS